MNLAPFNVVLLIIAFVLTVVIFWPAIRKRLTQFKATKGQSTKTEADAQVDDWRIRAWDAAGANAARVGNQLKAALEQPDIVKKYELLCEVHENSLGTPKERERLNETKAELAHPYATALLERARNGDRDSFKKLNRFADHPRTDSHRRYVSATGNSYVYPEDWKDLVAEHYERPGWEDFRLQPDFDSSPDSVDIKRLAENALKSHSLRDAKIALAYCDYGKPDRVEPRNGEMWMQDVSMYFWRIELGDHVYRELEAMVNALHAEKGVFQR